MLTTEASELPSSLLQTILADESYRPAEPTNISETGLPSSLIESLICKRLALIGMTSGRELAEDICLPFNMLESVFGTLRSRQIIVHKGSAPLNDYLYSLTEQGQDRARAASRACAYRAQCRYR